MLGEQFTPRQCPKRAKFLPEEDAQLRELVRLHGTLNWPVVAAKMPGRDVRQCRDRWKHYLSSEKPVDSWTPEEDNLLYEKMQLHGPLWTRLAGFFPGRTDFQVKARWMRQFASSSSLHLDLQRNKHPVFVPTTYEIPTVQLVPVPMEPVPGMPGFWVRIDHPVFLYPGSCLNSGACE
jgi:hypothetical protein